MKYSFILAAIAAVAVTNASELENEVSASTEAQIDAEVEQYGYAGYSSPKSYASPY